MKKAYTVEIEEQGGLGGSGHPIMVFERLEDAEEFEMMVRENVVIREILFVEDNRLAKEAREYCNAQAKNG